MENPHPRPSRGVPGEGEIFAWREEVRREEGAAGAIGRDPKVIRAREIRNPKPEARKKSEARNGKPSPPALSRRTGRGGNLRLARRSAKRRGRGGGDWPRPKGDTRPRNPKSETRSSKKIRSPKWKTLTPGPLAAYRERGKSSPGAKKCEEKRARRGRLAATQR